MSLVKQFSKKTFLIDLDISFFRDIYIALVFFFGKFFRDFDLYGNEQISLDIFLDMFDSVIFELEDLTMLSSCRNVDYSFSEDWNLQVFFGSEDCLDWIE